MAYIEAFRFRASNLIIERLEIEKNFKKDFEYTWHIIIKLCGC